MIRKFSLITLILCFVLFLIPLVSGALTDNLVLYYSFDVGNVSGTTVDNLQGNSAYDGTITGTKDLTNSSCGIGQCIRGASDTSITTGYTAGLQNYTACAWINDFTDQGDTRSLGGTRVTGGSGTIWNYNDNNVALRIYNADNSQTQTKDTVDGNFPTLSHFCYVRNGTTQPDIIIHVNGTAETMVAGGSTAPQVITGDELTFLRSINGYCENCEVDEIAFWNRSLTSEETTELYNSGSGCSYPFTNCDESPPATDTVGLADFPNIINITNTTRGTYTVPYNIFNTSVKAEYNLSYLVLDNITNASSLALIFNTSEGLDSTINVTTEDIFDFDTIGNLTAILTFNRSNPFLDDENEIDFSFDANMTVDFTFFACPDIDFVACDNGANTTGQVRVFNTSYSPSSSPESNGTGDPFIITPIPEISIGAESTYQINTSSHYGNYSQINFTVTNPANGSTMVIPNGTAFDFITYYNITFSANNLNLIINSYSANLTFNVNVSVTNGNQSFVTDTFNITINTSTLLPQIIKPFPDTIKDCPTHNYTINITEYYENFDEAYLYIDNPKNASTITIDLLNEVVDDVTNVWNYFVVGIPYTPTQSALFINIRFLDFLTNLDSEVDEIQGKIQVCNEAGGCLTKKVTFESGTKTECAMENGFDGIIGKFFDDIFGGFVNIFGSAFPESDSLSLSQRYAYILSVMALLGIILFGLLAYLTKEYTLAFIVTSVFELLLFGFFISIGYVGVGTLIVLFLLLLTLGYFKIKSGGGGGG